MELRVIRAGSRDALDAKHYTIAIGCSLGNKWFTPENVRGLVLWALANSSGRVCVYVADTIHAINLAVRQSITLETATKKAHRMGESFIRSVKEGLVDLPKDEFSRLDFGTWADIVTIDYQKDVQFLKDLYASNEEFHKTILHFVTSRTQQETRPFRPEQEEQLTQYILEELPMCISAVPIHSTVYDAWVYPSDGALTEFFEKLENGEMFPVVAATIVKQKKALLVVN